MDSLTDHDAARLVDVVRELQAVGSLVEFPRLAMRAVARIVPSDFTSFNDVDPEAGTIVADVEPERELFEGAYETFGRLQADHPLIQHTHRTGDGSAMKISDFLDAEAWHDTAIYREIFVRLGYEHQMSITLPAVRPRIIGLALNRTAEHGDFTERDRTVLNHLRPHLAQTYELLRLRADLEAQRSLTDVVLADLGADVILLADPPAEMTAGALDRLRRAFGTPETGGLPPGVTAWVEAQRERLRSPGPAGVEPLEALTAVAGEARLVLRFVAGGARVDGEVADAIVMTRTSPEPSIDDLTRLGLSRREAEVMQRVVAGASNAEVAAALDISAGTVKKHLEHVFAKLGVSSRTRAAAYCLELLAGVPRAD